jgi:hypothetical protein
MKQSEPLYKLDWIDLNKISWDCLSPNPNAIHLLEKNQDKIHWEGLSLNQNAIHLLEKNQDKIDWRWLSRNPNAINLLEKNLDKVKWEWLSRNPNAIHLLEKNPDKINWHRLSANTAIFEIDYEALKKRCLIYSEELIQKVFHPSRIQKYLDMGISIDELDNCI